MLKYDAVIFDLDDTLILERDFVKSGFQAVAGFIESEYGINPENTYRTLLELHYMEKKNVFNRFLLMNRIENADIVKEMIRIYKTHIPQITLLPDAEFAVENLKRMGAKLGIITDGDVIPQRNKLRAICAERYFDAIVISDDFGIENRKPSELPYKECLNRLDITDYTKAVYVGDNISKDFITAKRLGLYTVQIERTEGIYRNVCGFSEEYYADVKIKDLRELLNIL